MKAFKWWIVEELFRQLKEAPERHEAFFTVDEEVKLRLANLGVGYSLTLTLYKNEETSPWSILPLAVGTSLEELKVDLEKRLLISDIIENKLSYKYPEF